MGSYNYALAPRKHITAKWTDISLENSQKGQPKSCFYGQKACYFQVSVPTYKYRPQKGSLSTFQWHPDNTLLLWKEKPQWKTEPVGAPIKQLTNMLVDIVGKDSYKLEHTSLSMALRNYITTRWDDTAKIDRAMESSCYFPAMSRKHMTVRWMKSTWNDRAGDGRPITWCRCKGKMSLPCEWIPTRKDRTWEHSLLSLWWWQESMPLPGH